MRRSNAPTLQDVASEAGVTAMVASVVLNGARSSTRVSESTRSRVVAAATRLGYRPNAVARGLFRRRMDSIGVVAIVDGQEVNFYFLDVLNGILEAASEHGQNVTIFSVKHWEDADPTLLRFCDGRVDGMVLVGPVLPPEFAESLQRHTPFVTLHSNAPLPNTCNLSNDDAGGAYAAVRYLLEHGHRRIAHLTVDAGLLGAAQRLGGYRRALDEAGVPYDPSLVLRGDFSIVAGREMTRTLLDRCAGGPEDLPTAIFCASDAIAFGCIETLTGRGIRVPTDISVVGFDDTPTALMTNPPLTTVHQPFRAMGRRAVELLLPQIGGGEEGTAEAPIPAAEVFDVHLVVRGSVTPPRAAADEGMPA